MASTLLAVPQATDRLTGLEQQWATQLADLKTHSLDVYKRGFGGFIHAGRPALYFEIRIDARAVDPVQWFKSRWLCDE